MHLQWVFLALHCRTLTRNRDVRCLEIPNSGSRNAINVEPEGQPTPFCSKTKPGLMRVSVVRK